MPVSVLSGDNDTKEQMHTLIYTAMRINLLSPAADKIKSKRLAVLSGEVDIRVKMFRFCGEWWGKHCQFLFKFESSILEVFSASE